MRLMRVAVVAAGLAISAHAYAEAPAVVVPKFRGTPAEVLPDEKGPRRLIRFLTSPDYPPFQFLKADQSPAGFNIDLARAICAELEFPCTIQALPWDELPAALESGRADALVASYRPSEELYAKSSLTRPYFRLPARFAVRKGDTTEISPSALEGKKIAVVTGSAHEAFLKEFFQKAALSGFADAEGARTALKDGAADLLFADGAGLSLWLGGTASADCCAFAGGPYFESRFFGEGLVIAVRKGDNRLRQDLDRALDQIDEKDQIGDIYLRWFPVGIF